ncbi:hypothetical protein P4O66_017072 [Electrophorus voltai]|uniref:C2H2-type domain-containing protein n=1 Tax=Electrophorus voltai TaxID=2609070 RepID=A0AAD9DMJ4_9TELE|nr:hypothetical protein P4O66_017072 [Electrophorus voltai]
MENFTARATNDQIERSRGEERSVTRLVYMSSGGSVSTVPLPELRAETRSRHIRSRRHGPGLARWSDLCSVCGMGLDSRLALEAHRRSHSRPAGDATPACPEDPLDQDMFREHQEEPELGQQPAAARARVLPLRLGFPVEFAEATLQ